MILRAPFPWFGGKSRAAPLIWPRFGDVPNYVEPFFGSGAVLLGRPHPARIETVNDKDGFVSNFWRAVQSAPAEVAEHADWPVNENDLHARHSWLTGQRSSLVSRLEGDHGYFDATVAGWWVWGMAAWIGGEFCSGEGPWVRQEVAPGDWRLVKDRNDGAGVRRRNPDLRGFGRGVNRQLLYLYGAGQGVNRPPTPWLQYFLDLQARLRKVRVCSGDWLRVCGPTPTFHNGLTAVFLDPPYSQEAGRDDVYAVDDKNVAHDVREWAIAMGYHPQLQIALCCYEGEYEMPDDWECVKWKAHGGYGNQAQGRGRENSGRERIWFSPHCLRPRSR